MTGTASVAWPSTAGGAGTDDLPLVVAHRGLHGSGKPIENTAAAIRGAAEIGADVAEIDVLQTRDGVLVLHHDPTIGFAKIAETDFADLPTHADGSRLTTLQEAAVTAAATGIDLQVELKATGFEAAAVDAVAAVLPTNRFQFISFNKSSIQAIEAHAPEVETGILDPLIWEWLRESPVWPTISWFVKPLNIPLRRVESSGADFVSVHTLWANDRLLNAAQDKGVDVYVWTPTSDRALAKFARDDRVAGVVTDRPERALEMQNTAFAGVTELVEAIHAA